MPIVMAQGKSIAFLIFSVQHSSFSIPRSAAVVFLRSTLDRSDGLFGINWVYN
jgi:hypothetical protein